MGLRTTLRRLGLGYKAVCLGAALPTALAGGASAATLAFSQLHFTFGALPTVTFPAVGATGTTTGNLSASVRGSGVFNGAFTTVLPTSAAPPISVQQVIVTKNASATFTGTEPSKVAGSLAIEGVINVYGANGFPTGGPPLLSVPLVIGTPNTVSTGGGITVIGGAWTAGTAVVTGVTTPASPNATASAFGANELSPSGAGTLVLVTPVKIITGVGGDIAAFGVLQLSYVPEPGTALLLGLGVAGLAALGRRRL